MSHPSGSNPANPGSAQSKVFDFTKRKKWADLLVNELSGVVMLVLSNAGDIIFCGEAAKELLNWSNAVPGSKFTDYMHPDDGKAFSDQFHACIHDPAELAIYVRLKSLFAPASSSVNSKAQWPLFEVKGHPHFATLPAMTSGPSGANWVLDCKCFFIMARPYPTRGSDVLDSFLELKLENERLQQRLQDLRGAGAVHSSGDSLPGGLESLSKPSVHPAAEADNPYYAYPPPFGRSSVGGQSYAEMAYDEQQLVGPSNQFRRGSIAGIDDVVEEGLKKKKRKSTTVDHHVCVTCGRTDSPEWRKGPQGPKTLCNACGLRHSKKAKKQPEGETKEDEDDGQSQQQQQQQQLQQQHPHRQLAPRGKSPLSEGHTYDSSVAPSGSSSMVRSYSSGMPVPSPHHLHRQTHPPPPPSNNQNYYPVSMSVPVPMLGMSGLPAPRHVHPTTHAGYTMSANHNHVDPQTHFGYPMDENMSSHSMNSTYPPYESPDPRF